MQVPPPESFTHESGDWIGPPWWAPVAGTDFDLHVPDGEDGPDPQALAFAQRVLPRVHELRDQAARYIAQAVQVRSNPRLETDEAQIVSVFCDAGSGTTILELNWEADLYSLWHVRFTDHPTQGLHPVAFGCRPWGGGLPPWRPPSRPL